MGGTVRNSTHRSASIESAVQVGAIWRRIFGQAIRTDATDIHIEPQTEALAIRFRRQGALSTELTLEAKVARPLAMQLKQLADMDLKQTKAPQEGAFTQVHNHHTYRLSVDTMPLISGERIVIHILDPVAEPPELAALGLWGEGLTCVQNALVQPHGLILISGPSHSGLSSTLAGCAAALSSNFTQVASVEETPVSHVPAVSYMAVKPVSGMTWSRVLRMQLKHQPDAVILGNIPDRETAEIAVNAANKQQLVLCSIRADSPATALLQLLRLSGNPLDLAASLRLVCAQRLVPRLCPDCRETYSPDLALRSFINQKFQLDLADNLVRLQRLVAEATRQGLRGQGNSTAALNTSNHGITRLWRPKAGGCRKCHKSGYQGAIALFEVIPISEELRGYLVHPPANTPAAKSLSENRVTSITVDALVKALCGLIAIDAVANI